MGYRNRCWRLSDRLQHRLGTALGGFGEHRLLTVSPDLVETALDLELQDGTVIADNLDDGTIFFTGLHHAERAIAVYRNALAIGVLQRTSWERPLNSRCTISLR
jgi:hypothetical protein